MKCQREARRTSEKERKRERRPCGAKKGEKREPDRERITRGVIAGGPAKKKAVARGNTSRNSRNRASGEATFA